MKTTINKEDRILWLFIAALFFIFSLKIATAQPNATDVIKIKISGNGYSDETFVRFKNGASTAFEGNNDAWKMFSTNPNVPMIFTKISGYAVSLNTFPALDKKVEMDVFTKIHVAGNYTVTTKIVSPFSPDVKIFLIDNLTGNIHNIYSDSVLYVNLPVDSGNTARYQLYFFTTAQYSVSNLTCFKNKDGKISLENLSAKGWQMEIRDENNIYHKIDSGSTESHVISDLSGVNYTAIINYFQNISDTFQITVQQPEPVLSVFETGSEDVCLCNGAHAQFYNYSSGAKNYEWNFGDGIQSAEEQPKHGYAQEGDYLVSLAVNDGKCYDTSYKLLHVIANYPLGTIDAGVKEALTVYSDGENYILKTGFSRPENINVEVFNLAGQKVYSKIHPGVSSGQISIRLSEKRNQMYIFSVKAGEDFRWAKVVF